MSDKNVMPVKDPSCVKSASMPAPIRKDKAMPIKGK